MCRGNLEEIRAKTDNGTGKRGERSVPTNAKLGDSNPALQTGLSSSSIKTNPGLILQGGVTGVAPEMAIKTHQVWDSFSLSQETKNRDANGNFRMALF